MTWHQPDPRRRLAIACLALGAVVWSVLLVVAAFGAPVYSSGETLYGMNGSPALIAVAVPLALAVLNASAVRRFLVAGSRAAKATTWTSAWILFAFAFLAGFSIGLFIVPAALMALAATGLASRPGRPRPTVRFREESRSSA